MATAQRSTSQPATTLLILGASGDLTSRLLLPGIATLLQIEPQRRVEIVGADLRQLSDADWAGRVQTALAAGSATGEAAEHVLRSTRYVASDATDPESLAALIASIPCDRLVIYFALPPHVTQLVCTALEQIGVPEGTILAIEKPFGASLESARELNALVTRIVPEDRVFRIDHFLGLHTVLNLIGLRFANRLFEPVWDRDSIAKVEVLYDETVTLEGRAGYYDRNGALRDMIQSHLLQIMALIAIEPISSVTAGDLRDAISQVLRASSVVDPIEHSRRARYTAGSVESRAVPDYVAEDGVDPALGTETLAEVQVEIATARWAGVPFILRSGKSLGGVRKRAVIHWKPPAHVPTGFGGHDSPDCLVIDFKPDGFELHITTNGKGDPFTLEQTVLRGELGGGQLLPYGEVLASILDSDPRIAVRGDAAEECWRIIEPVLAAWRADAVPMDDYAAGSTGPEGWETSRA
ncbi:glucose-6-phosphate dehydrogenase [Agrococcus sp. Marseille-P2731]|uniref:glucose-6-phosphate dehydrogenase n=1 Tax=Agrococcus sp. Marseille-P2731 TaxID=1841862 RepID=UPI00092FEA73|nr:glucose-6-phosphate dehydrogenase [Agrococcus sp. Marseille-P2731]